MSRPPSSLPPLPPVRLMFEPSHLALGCLATAYARLVPRSPVVRLVPPPLTNAPVLATTPPAGSSIPGGI